MCIKAFFFLRPLKRHICEGDTYLLEAVYLVAEVKTVNDHNLL